MTLPDKLMEKLVCPQCKNRMHLGKENSCLICDACNLGYRIVDNIPILLIDEAEKL